MTHLFLYLLYITSGNTVHNLKCCAMPEYSYGHCNTFSSSYGVPIDCRDHVDGTVLEGQCHSGRRADCHGDYNRSENGKLIRSQY